MYRINKHTFAAACKPKSCERPDDPEDILRIKCPHFALGRVGAMDRKLRPGSGDNLLLLGSSKLAENSLSDSCWRLDCQGVHKQRRGCCHGGQISRRVCSGSPRTYFCSFRTRDTIRDDAQPSPWEEYIIQRTNQYGSPMVVECGLLLLLLLLMLSSMEVRLFAQQNLNRRFFFVPCGSFYVSLPLNRFGTLR